MNTGWIVNTLGRHGAAVVPMSEAAIATAPAEALGTVAAEPDRLELPARALGLEAGAAPRWWRT